MNTIDALRKEYKDNAQAEKAYIRHEKSLDKHYDEHYVENFNGNMAYVTFMPCLMDHLQEEITGNSWMLFCELCLYTASDYSLRPHGDKRYKPFRTNNEIAKTMKYSAETFKRRMRILIDHELILIRYDNDGKIYYVNPYIFIRSDILQNYNTWMESYNRRE